MNIYNECKSGKLLCGECKGMLAPRVRKYIEDHQSKREDAKDRIDDYIVEDIEGGLKKRSEK